MRMKRMDTENGLQMMATSPTMYKTLQNLSPRHLKKEAPVVGIQTQ
jgi:hypothetical protein